jgi:Skp family chaperone for outer membrane proteins
VRKSHLLSATGVASFKVVLGATVLIIALIAAYSVAQPPAAAPAMRQPGSGVNIALLDVSYIFKKHARFNASMEEMKGDVERAEAQIKADQDAIKTLTEKLERYRKGTPDYKSLSEEITKRRADMSVNIQLQKEEFLQQEAKIYYNVYQEIQQEVNYYAAANGIGMVLRFNGDPVDVAKPETVIRGINGPVVWYAKELDITPVILEHLNRANLNPGMNRVGTPQSRPGVTAPFNR